LSINGGGIRGVIPAVLVDYMETQAYTYAKAQGYLELKRYKSKVKKIQIKELFDQISGTSTGSILAATLGVPNDELSNNSYYASDVIDFFMTDGPLIFTSNTINLGMLWIITIITGLIACRLGYRIGIKFFANPRLRKELHLYKMIIKELKSSKREHRKTLLAAAPPTQDSFKSDSTDNFMDLPLQATPLEEEESTFEAHGEDLRQIRESIARQRTLAKRRQSKKVQKLLNQEEEKVAPP
jgi:hypothetical protein